MFCNKCGKQIAEGSMFCNFCGAPVEVPVEPAAPEVLAEEPAAKNSGKPVFEEFNWNVNDYPSKDKIRKTEDIDFDWNIVAKRRGFEDMRLEEYKDEK